MKVILLLALAIKAIFFTNLTQAKAKFFVGIGYINLGDRYNYSKLNATQYIGTVGNNPFLLNLNDYINVEFKRTSSFGINSSFSGSGIALSFGNKFRLGNFFYTVEIFGNYSGAKVVDTTMIPEFGIGIPSNEVINSVNNVIKSTISTISSTGSEPKFSDITKLVTQSNLPSNQKTILNVAITGVRTSICGGIFKDCAVPNSIPSSIASQVESAICNGEASCTLSFKTPEQNIPIIYSMPVNIGMQNRFGYNFNKNFSLNLITGGTMTIFNITQGVNQETVYKGRFIAGFGAEFNVTKNRNLKLYADYKYYIPLKKDIEREYPDQQNPGKTTKVKITNFGAETQAFELGFKYYF